MDYKEQIEQAKHAAEKWREKHRIVGVGEFRVDCMVDDLTRSITDLLARAEAAEARVRELETSFRTEKCENGPECAELGRARKRAEAAEARCRLAEKCFDDSALHACETQLELEKKARTEAEARAEKAERERDAAVSDLETVMAYGGGNLDTCQFCKNGQCYVRGGTKLCLPKWRGKKED